MNLDEAAQNTLREGYERKIAELEAQLADTEKKRVELTQGVSDCLLELRERYESQLAEAKEQIDEAYKRGYDHSAPDATALREVIKNLRGLDMVSNAHDSWMRYRNPGEGEYIERSDLDRLLMHNCTSPAPDATMLREALEEIVDMHFEHPEQMYKDMQSIARDALLRSSPAPDATVLREVLAGYAHKAWSGWMAYLFSKCTAITEGRMVIPAWAVDRWKRQASTEYKNLSQEEQYSDRAEADKILALLRSSPATGEEEAK